MCIIVAMSNKNTKVFLSLKVKIVLLMNVMLLLLAGFLTYININLIVKDKQAYVFDAVLKSSRNAELLLERLLESKQTFSQLIIRNFKRDLKGIFPQLESDADLFQFGTLKLKGTRYQSTSLYVNQDVFKRYQRDINFLNLTEKDFKRILENQSADSPLVKFYYHSAKSTPRLIIIYKTQNLENFVYFDYVLDNAFVDLFSNESSDILIVGEDNSLIYHNFPTGEKKEHYQKMIAEKRFVKNAASYKGSVKEVTVGSKPYILSGQGVRGASDIFVLSGISGDKAFEVTNFLILQSFVYILFSIGAVTLIALFFSRQLAKPLSDLMESIKDISKGNFKTKVNIRSRDEFAELGRSFNFMLEKINEYHSTILDYSQSLEQKVEERTKEIQKKNDEIKSMVDNVNQGFLVFNKEGIVGDLYTRASEEIFGINPQGQTLQKILKSNDEERDFLKNWTQNLFTEMIPFNSIKELGIRKRSFGGDVSDSSFKYVELDYFALRNKEDAVENVVMVANNRTEEYKVKLENRKQTDFINSTVKVINTKERFLVTCEQFEAQLKNAASQKWGKGEVAILLHSIKGGISLYGFNILVDFIHHKEDELKLADSEESISNILELTLSEFKAHTDKVIFYVNELSQGGAGATEVLSKVYAVLKDMKHEDLIPKIEASLKYEDPQSYLRSNDLHLKELSKKLEKKIAPITFKTNGISLDLEKYRSLFDSFVHIFRNILDHGIEAPSERTELGKDASGSILVAFEQLESGLHIKISDDGRGISPDLIRAKMRERKVSEDILKKDDPEIIQHIFDEEFSTAQKVTEISGRGVGLYDVKKQVEALGGEVTVQSSSGHGTDFIFKLPAEV